MSVRETAPDDVPAESRWSLGARSAAWDQFWQQFFAFASAHLKPGPDGRRGGGQWPLTPKPPSAASSSLQVCVRTTISVGRWRGLSSTTRSRSTPPGSPPRAPHAHRSKTGFETASSISACAPAPSPKECWTSTSTMISLFHTLTRSHRSGCHIARGGCVATGLMSSCSL